MKPQHVADCPIRFAKFLARQPGWSQLTKWQKELLLYCNKSERLVIAHGIFRRIAKRQYRFYQQQFHDYLAHKSFTGSHSNAT